MAARSFIFSLLVSTLLSVVPPFAAAGMIVQPVVKDSSNFFADTVFDRFDPTLGTLTQVTLDIDLSLTVFDMGFGVCTVLGCAGDITLAVDGVQSLMPLSETDSKPVTDAEVDVGVGVDLAVSAFNVDFSNLADFILPGPNPRLTTSFMLPGFGVASFFDQTGNITLTYQFDEPVVTPSPVPEPATLVLFGLGLAGLGMSRRSQSV